MPGAADLVQRLNVNRQTIIHTIHLKDHAGEDILEQVAKGGVQDVALPASAILEVILEEHKGGTKVNLKHSNIPKGQGKGYKKGRIDFYFRPMQEYFKNN